MNTCVAHRGLLVTLLFASVVVAACGSSATSVQTGPIRVQTSDMWVTIENQAGMPVTDLTIEVVPYGNVPFSTTHYRLENGESHDIGVNEFRGRDGTPLNLHTSKPKLVRVRGTNISGQPVAVEVAWRR